MNGDVLDVWITKRALSAGVEKAQVRVSPLGLPFVVETSDLAQAHVIGKDAHLTRGEAIAVAQAERARQVHALERQIARLRALDFEAV